MKCPSCGKDNENGVKFCSLCGTQLPTNENQNPQPQQQYQQAQQQPQQSPKEPVYKRTWFVILWLILFWPVGVTLMWVNKKSWKTPVKVIITAFLVLCAIINLFSCGSGSKETNTVNSSLDAKVTTTVETEQETEETETENMTVQETEPETELETDSATEAQTEAETEPIATVDITKEGTYKVGQDIPAGEYCVFAMGSYGGYYSVNADSFGDSIIGNDNFYYNAFVTVYDGQYLELSRAMAIPAEQIAGSMYEIMTDGDGEFRIGTDLAAGEYKLESTDEFGGYYCVYNSSDPDAEIVTNDNFDGQTYVTVSDGQYLLLSRCKIVQ